MLKVVGIDNKFVKRISCRHCAADIGYTEGEVKLLWMGEDYAGGPDGAKGFSCPNCGKDVYTERW